MTIRRGDPRAQNIKKMKFRSILYAAASAALSVSMLASCSGKDGDESKAASLADYKDLSAGDSVAFYIGQITALDYWQAAQQDTVMKSRESRDQFLKGLRAGYEAVRDNDAYNRGYYTGVQLAMQLKEFGEDYETTVNRQVVFDAFADGLRNDSAINPSDAQMNFNQVTDALNARKEAKDKAAAQEILKKEAAAKGWQMVNDGLYASKATGPEDTPLLKDGDAVKVSLSVAGVNGTEIDRRENADLIVGKAYPGPVTQALLSMRLGQTRTFFTYAQAIFGRMFARYGMKATDIVAIRISTSKAEPQPAVTPADESAE